MLLALRRSAIAGENVSCEIRNHGQAVSRRYQRDYRTSSFSTSFHANGKVTESTTTQDRYLNNRLLPPLATSDFTIFLFPTFRTISAKPRIILQPAFHSRSPHSVLHCNVHGNFTIYSIRSAFFIIKLNYNVLLHF